MNIETLTETAAEKLAGTDTDLIVPHSAAGAFRNLVLTRKSVRAFERRPVKQAVIEELLELASWSPSNCNSQPWRAYLASGKTVDRVREELLADVWTVGYSRDIPYNVEHYTPEMRARQIEHVEAQQAALGIAREDLEARKLMQRANLSFFGAPHVAFLYLPDFGNEREASDIGMFAQTLLLAIEAYGLAGVPQTSVGSYAAPIRRVINPDPAYKLMFAISFGYEDKSNAGSRLDQTRTPVKDFTTFLD